MLLDSNLLVLFLVGNGSPSRVGHQRRLKQYDLDDLTRLNDIVEYFQRHVSLPNVLTEASNLIGSGKQEIAPGAASALATYCREIHEIYADSSNVVDLPQYQQLGLTDSAVLWISSNKITVLTDDHDLYGHVNGRGCKAINLYHSKKL